MAKFERKPLEKKNAIPHYKIIVLIPIIVFFLLFIWFWGNDLVSYLLIIGLSVIEAALVIENGYSKIVDEMWYIHTDEKTRRDRLKASRGYSDEKIDSIMREQLSEEEFHKNCSTVIDNSKTLESAYGQIDRKLGERLCQKQ